MKWKDHQSWEESWHGDCINSYWEETKQIVYAKRMGLEATTDNGKYPVYDLKGNSIADIGGGPYSILLKAINLGKSVVIDPCDYPAWTTHRYITKGIKVEKMPAEDYKSAKVFDEVWIYNCLQHTIDPEKIINNAKAISKIIRIYEWIDNGISIGHPHDLKEDLLNKWLGGVGKVEKMNESGCHGKAYYGIFKGNHYE